MLRRQTLLGTIALLNITVVAIFLPRQALALQPSEALNVFDVLSAKEFRLVGPDERMTAQLTTAQEGTPSLFFYDKNGKLKLNLGIYHDGAPTIVLFDNKNQASAILRLADADGQPVLIFKENGQDKMIIGLHNRSIIKPGGSLTSAFSSIASLFLAAIIGLIAGFIGSKVGNIHRNPF